MTPQAFIREILTLWEGNHLAQAPALEAIRACLDGVEKPKNSIQLTPKGIYELYFRGSDWDEIANITGMESEKVKDLARLHATKEALPWPIPPITVQP